MCHSGKGLDTEAVIRDILLKKMYNKVAALINPTILVKKRYSSTGVLL